MTDEPTNKDEAQQSEESPGVSDLLVGDVLDRSGALIAPASTQLGSARYVHASFIAAAILVGYVTSQLFTLIWNRLAEVPWALRALPQLVRYDEEVRGDVGLMVGAVVGIVTVIRIYRRPAIRSWADDVAAELAKVSWPDREAITNNTVIVIVSCLVATLYVTVLDRFWAFSTGLIYAP
jgi:preprotein translocase subunit SecE